MEIRALTGFNEQTRRRYGRSYSPLNGTRTCTALGSPQSYGVDFDIPTQVTLPSYIPQQEIEMIDVNTGRKKIFTVENINQLTELIKSGFALYSALRGGRGTGVTVDNPTPPPAPPTTAGLNVTTAVAGLVGAYLIFSLLMSKK
jgi:hypothetical protein